jgi:hypothetical protein
MCRGHSARAMEIAAYELLVGGTNTMQFLAKLAILGCMFSAAASALLLSMAAYHVAVHLWP